MVGINGLYYLDGRDAQSGDLRRMVQATALRGTHEAALMIDGCTGLACRYTSPAPGYGAGDRRAIARRTGLYATANARLDHRDELLDELDVTKAEARTASDALLIARAYERWGERCVDHLLGAFAFVIWDVRKRQIFCARDHLGLRPLYYVRTKSVFAFASEIKALLALPHVSRRINETRVADYLTQVTEDKEATFYEDVQRVLPAHTLIVSPGGVRMQPYWRLDGEREIRLPNDEAYARTFRELFIRAVRDRVRDAAPLGSLLSGGLDSSAVTCTARRLIGADDARPLRTFSLVFDDVPRSDERRYIEAVLNQGGLLPHFTRGDRIQPFEELDRMLSQLDEPFFTPNLFLNRHLWRRGSEQGVRVMLDGFLGDNVVSHGSRYITELAAGGQWLRLAREIHTITHRTEDQSVDAWCIFRRFVLNPMMVEPLMQLRNRFKSSGHSGSADGRCLNREFARRIHGDERARSRGAEMNRTPFSAREEHVRELTSGVLPAALEIAYKSASAFGVEPRFPFADRRLLEFCVAIPPTQKYSSGMTRVVVRRALGDSLPDLIRTRQSKGNLAPNFARSLLVLARDELREHVYAELPFAAQYLDVPALQEEYRQLLRSPKSEAALLRIWRAVVLTRWLKIEQEASSSCRAPDAPGPVEESYSRRRASEPLPEPLHTPRTTEVTS